MSYKVGCHVGVGMRGKLVFLVSQAEFVLRNAEKLVKCQGAEQCSELCAEFSTDCAVGR